MAMGPWGGHLSMAMAPWGSPNYGHGPMGGPPVPWPHGCHLPMAMGPWVLDPVLLKSVELSFDLNRCPLGHSAYGHGPMGGHLWPQAHGGSPTYGHGPLGGPPWGNDGKPCSVG